MNVKLSVTNQKKNITLFFFIYQLLLVHSPTKLKMQHPLYMWVVSAEYDNEIRPILHAKKSGILNSMKVLIY